MEIPSISLSNIANAAAPTGGVPASGSSEKLADSFSRVLQGLNSSQQSADSLVQQLSAGGDVDLHQVMIGMEENDVNFRVALAIRDKLVDAYREVMRMSV